VASAAGQMEKPPRTMAETKRMLNRSFELYGFFIQYSSCMNSIEANSFIPLHQIIRKIDILSNKIECKLPGEK
jgi:hypothetical protein